MELQVYIILGTAHLLIALCMILRRITHFRWTWMAEVILVIACSTAYFSIAEYHGLSTMVTPVLFFGWSSFLP